MSQLKKQLSKLIPRFSGEANKITDQKARSRWMKIRKITLSPRSIADACRFFGMSEDAYNKWGKRLLKTPRAKALEARSRKPKRSPRKTQQSIEKKVLKIRKVQPYLGPDRISNDLLNIYGLQVASSTVYAILRRARLVSHKLASTLTKKHLKRYRRPFPGYLQMDFKYVPYKIQGKQYYQLSCVDHHSSWRLIRIYRNKDIKAVLTFLTELEDICPFPVMEIQTDNDTAFTDKFSSGGLGVTGGHAFDKWCSQWGIIHKLIPVAVKELNGKVENTHKQDDREFYAIGEYTSFEQIELNIKGYNQRWNYLRRTRALGYQTPNLSILAAYSKALAMHQIWEIKSINDLKPLVAGWPVAQKKKNRTRKISSIEKYLNFLEWESKNKNRAITLLPTMSQNFSQPHICITICGSRD